MNRTGPARRRAPASLLSQMTWRLLAVALLFAVLNAGIVVASYALDQQEMSEDFLGAQAERLDVAWRESGGAAVRLDPPPGVTRWAYRLADPQGRTLIAEGAMAMRSLDPGLLDETRRDRIAGGVRISGVRRLSSGGAAFISADTRGFGVYLPVIVGELGDHVLLPLVPLTLLLMLFSVGVVRRVLRPLGAAAMEADRLDPGRMDLRLTEPDTSREVSALVSAVNRALDRVQRSMKVLRDFTADAAHELRTPLAVLRLQLDELPDGPARRKLQEEVTAMTRLVNQLLDLSQAEVLQLEGAATVDLLALAQGVVAQTAPLVFADDGDIRLVDLGAAPVAGHPEALARALRNLVENALRHGGPGGQIEVIAGPGPRLTVRDHGPGLRGADPDLLFRRFWRSNPDRPGAGLGLGIARSIVEAHGGSIEARDAEGGGACFVCAFPERGSRPRR